MSVWPDKGNGCTNGSNGSSPGPEDDRRLVERCLAGEGLAWEKVYDRCHPSLIRSIKSLLGPRRANHDLAEEIASLVWCSLVEDDARRLAQFDPRMGNRLTTFVCGMARNALLGHLRAERRRRSRERAAGRREVSRDCLPWSFLDFDYFLADLTPRERHFLEVHLLRRGTTGFDRSLSTQNVRQLVHRVRSKLLVHVNGPDNTG